MVKNKERTKKYWNIGEWNKLSANEQHQIFDERKTWNLGRKNNSDNGRQLEINTLTQNNISIKSTLG